MVPYPTMIRKLSQLQVARISFSTVLLLIYSQEDWVLCRVFYKSRGLSPKQGNITTAMENCTYMAVDDAGSSSLPPLMETYMHFDHPQNHTNTADINNNVVSVHPGGYNINEPKVPCFSNLRFHTTQLPPLIENANNNLPAASSTSTSQIGRTTATRLPDITSFLGPLVNYGCEN